MSTTERWLPVLAEPDYLVSNHGRVASVKTGEPRILRGFINDGYRCITTRDAHGRHTRAVHRLVAEAFIGPRPEGLQTRHLNGDRLDNRVDNLEYGTHADNMQDRLAHGRHPMANKTHCKRDHEFTPENTRVYRGARVCRACKRERETSYMFRAAGIEAA